MASRADFKMTPTFTHLLIALHQGERHGYRMMQEIEERSGGKVRLGPSSLYWALGKLADAGFIEETDPSARPDADDERRRYWRITPAGRIALREEITTMARLVEEAEALKVIEP